MRFKVIFNTTGIILKYISLIFIFPVISAIYYKEYSSILPFLLSGLISFVLGLLFCLNDASEKDIDNITRPEAFGTVLSSWWVFGAICAIPFLFYDLSLINALFEAFSGVSTTGATILTDYSIYPKTFFIYRSLIQWFGGMGIIVLFIAVLPKFAVAGRQMFFAEAPNPTEEKITPRIRYTASWLWSIYILLTFIQTVVLKLSGLSFYDSICASLSTISAGGFSNTNSSFIGYADKIVWVLGIFTFLAGTNFILTYKVLIQGKIGEIFKSEEFRAYFLIVMTFTLALAFILCTEHSLAFFDAIRSGFFETATTITSTGSCASNYSLWPYRAKILLFVLMFIGGSAISASGSIKLTRWIYLIKFIKKELDKIIHPNAIIPVKLEGRIVAPEIGHQIIIFIMFFIAIFAASAILVGFIEQNTTIAITGSIATLSNTGPAFDSVIGPVGNYSTMRGITKLIFIFNMYIGRLEIIPFLALLHGDLWRAKK